MKHILTFITALTLAPLGSLYAAETASAKPNILYILCDDLGYGDVKCLGGERSKIATPNLDRLAAGGMIFTEAHSSSSVCTPTRYGILTGRYNWRSSLQRGVYGSKSKPLIAPNRLTVPSLLKEHGYATACIGKWHLGLDFDPKTLTGKIGNGPTTRGFDYFFGIGGSLDLAPFAYIENDRYTEAPTTVKTFGRKGPAAPGFEAVDVLPMLTRKSMEFIGECAKAKKPFFLYLALTSPHSPIVPTKEWLGKSGLNLYGDFVMQTDGSVGQVMDAIDKAGIAANTLVIFTSDNGCSPVAQIEELEGKGHFPSELRRGYKSDIWDGGHRIPFIARWPAKVKAGSRTDQLTCLTDLMATCAEVVGAKLPDSAGEDSVSLLPVLLGTAKEPLREAVVHHSKNGSFAIRQGQWKLGLCTGSGGWGKGSVTNAPGQLYDMSKDVGERANEYNQHPEIVAKLTQLLEKYVADGRSTPGPVQKNDAQVNMLKEARTAQSYKQLVQTRLREGLDTVARSPGMASREKNVGRDIYKSLLLFNENKNIAEAETNILNFCGNPLTTYVGKPVPQNRSEAMFRIYLTEKTRRLLSSKTRAVLEDYAWELLTQYSRRITRADADKPFWEVNSSENHYVNDRRRYTQALQIVRMSERYGPNHKLGEETLEAHYQAWTKFWIRYFESRAGQGTDMEIAHPSSYGECTVGVYYDLYDLTDSPRLRELAGKFLTLYWAEVAGEFEPRTGDRAVASTRNPDPTVARTYWAKNLLYCYGWHDAGCKEASLGHLPFLFSTYRPPEILRAIARNLNRGPYLATSRRALLIESEEKEKAGVIVFDKNGDGHFRRDVFYTPDYMLSTTTLDPAKKYNGLGVLAQVMGASFSTGLNERIYVNGRGYYGRRAISGITGTAASIIARDPHAEFGRARFKSDGTRVFISNGALWDNRVEDASGWFFARSGDAYVGLRVAGPGYTITTRKFIWPGRKLQEIEDKNGHYLELKDMWSPIVIQMGRAADYKSFDAFQASVKSKKFAYENNKLTYVSEAKDSYAYWANSKQLPTINGAPVNLNPAKTYDSPFLSMEHGSNKAVIKYPGYKDEVLDF